MRALLALLTVLLTLPALGQAPAPAAAGADGRLYDQGQAMTERSPRAHSALDAMRGLLGTWDVAVTTHPTDSTTHAARGQAEIIYMNRGYAYAERRRVPGYDVAGEMADAISFLVYQPSADRWGLGEASGYTEHVEVYDGTPDDRPGHLALRTATRPRGGMQLVHTRVAYAPDGADAFTVRVEASMDDGATWRPVEHRRYTRRADAPLLATGTGWGEPAEGLPAEARQFDFLLGEWTARHRILFAGQWISYPANATGVYTLGGKGVLEHNWFDLDPNLPDAATSIVRLYNRTARRWESLYLTNRFNGLLDFGGVWETDRLVLHHFDTHLGDAPVRYVFHDIEPDAYRWHAVTSRDRGVTYDTTWTIAFERR